MRGIIVLALLTACVPKGRYEVAQIQLGATRAALNAREAASREALEAAREREEALAVRVAETASQIAVQQEHVAELEAEVDRLARSNAEHVLRAAEVCLLPAGSPEEPVEPVDEALAPIYVKRAHIEASLDDVAEALAARAREELAVIERQHKHDAVVTAFAPLVEADRATVLQTDEGSVVRILVAKLYNENRTSLSPLGLEVLRTTTKALAELRDHDVTVVGHTDDVPYNSAQLPSNWELGFAYAAGVLRTLKDMGVTLPLVAGSRAGEEPAVPGTTPEARRLNRRVELVLVPREVELPEPEADPEGEGSDTEPVEEDAPVEESVPTEVPTDRPAAEEGAGGRP
jgi:flagellar motor protein MotB